MRKAFLHPTLRPNQICTSAAAAAVQLKFKSIAYRMGQKVVLLPYSRDPGRWNKYWGTPTKNWMGSLILCASTIHFYSVYITVLLAAMSEFKDIQQLVFVNTVLNIPPMKDKHVQCLLLKCHPQHGGW